MEVIENQSFQIELEDWGEIRFVSAYSGDMGVKLSFFLVDLEDNILYEFPDFSGNI